jgi:hypothetical protein
MCTFSSYDKIIAIFAFNWFITIIAIDSDTLYTYFLDEEIHIDGMYSENTRMVNSTSRYVQVRVQHEQYHILRSTHKAPCQHNEPFGRSLFKSCESLMFFTSL